MKTPLVYHGGKSRLATWICSKMPRHTVYVEPFFGGGAVYFSKPVPKLSNIKNYREVINDHDEKIVMFFRMLRDCPFELERLMTLTPYSRFEKKRAKAILDGKKAGSVAWAMLVASGQSFGHCSSSGGWKVGYESSNHPISFRAKMNALFPAVERLMSTYIECNDALNVIKLWDKPQTLFYCDPPYPGADQGPYGGYTLSDYQRLVELLSNCQGAVLLSNYPQNVKLPQYWQVYHRDDKNMRGNKKRELLFYKPRTGALRQEIKRIMAKECFDVFPNGG